MGHTADLHADRSPAPARGRRGAPHRRAGGAEEGPGRGRRERRGRGRGPAAAALGRRAGAGDPPAVALHCAVAGDAELRVGHVLLLHERAALPARVPRPNAAGGRPRQPGRDLPLQPGLRVGAPPHLPPLGEPRGRVAGPAAPAAGHAREPRPRHPGPGICAGRRRRADSGGRAGAHADPRARRAALPARRGGHALRTAHVGSEHLGPGGKRTELLAHGLLPRHGDRLQQPCVARPRVQCLQSAPAAVSGRRARRPRAGAGARARAARLNDRAGL
mmetsp:Transcript_21338/g.61705  ORF Transcript_21338/g.61705 Transcript_21338/m.61705 type:complete len:275 (-) Transcript_21338:73-897(-)